MCTLPSSKITSALCDTTLAVQELASDWEMRGQLISLKQVNEGLISRSRNVKQNIEGFQ